MIKLNSPVVYCKRCDRYYVYSENLKRCPTCKGPLSRKISYVLDAVRVKKKPFQKSLITEWLLNLKKEEFTCSFCKDEPVFQCIFLYKGEKYTSFCCSEHAQICMCWKLGGFSEDLTGEIENPLKIIDMINKSIVLDETKKLREYLYKLEEAYKNGDVSEIVYKKLKQEYESKLKEYLSVDNFR
ncbi:MAG: hypothetical protein ACP5HX_11485 [Thermoproteota archaeon]